MISDAQTQSLHPARAEVDLAAIRENVAAVCRHVAPAGVMAVVKADAYGHGAVPVARAALQSGASRLAVAHLAEAVELRNAGIKAPVLVFGGFLPEQLPEYHQYRLEMVLPHEQYWNELRRFAENNQQPVPVHLKFDTGMGRLGFPWQQCDEVLQKIAGASFLRPVGLMSHFAAADEADKSFADEQLRRFRHVCKAAQKVGLADAVMHMANSGAVLDLPDSRFQLVRPGIMLYGYYPSAETTESVPLRPALRWVSRLVQVKPVAAGETVSYGATWQAEHDTVIGTVATGYADGYLRALAGKMQVLVLGKRVPVVGRICMDMFMVDLGPDSHARAGDEVVLLGEQEDERISIAEFCQALDTIPYEITCMISKRVPRVWLHEHPSPSSTRR